MKTYILWYRNDLRVHDHFVLSKAVKEADRFLPVYVFNPDTFRMLRYGFPKTGYFRLKFLLESLIDLKNTLRNLGSDLHILTGKPSVVLTELASHLNARAIYASKEHTFEELKDESDLTDMLYDTELRFFEDRTLMNPGGTPFSMEKIPEVFTIFRKASEKNLEHRIKLCLPDPAGLPPLPDGIEINDIPTMGDFPVETPDVNYFYPDRFLGGETNGLKRFDYYVWESKRVLEYKQTRNGLVGDDYSSKFSPWLSLGCVSPRRIFFELKKFEMAEEGNASTYWLIFELLWRDYFRFVAIKHGKKIFYKGGLKNIKKSVMRDDRLFDNWKNGETGISFIDANMHELNATGYMSNRGRQVVANHFVHELQLDWRAGAAYFESQLIDYDVTSNWCNWMYVGGIGNDPIEDRRFDIEKQVEMYDPQGIYQMLWK